MCRRRKSQFSRILPFLILSLREYGDRLGGTAMTYKRIQCFEQNPIIAAVKSDEQLEQALKTECRVIFFLYGDICSIRGLIQAAKAADKVSFVHLDLIKGLSTKDVAVDFLRLYTEADGIISTRPEITKRARDLGLTAILRIFIIDSMALGNIEKQLRSGDPDILEIMPGVMPKVIRKICSMVSLPVIAGGLLTEKEDIINALSAGVMCISTTNETAWTEF